MKKFILTLLLLIPNFAYAVPAYDTLTQNVVQENWKDAWQIELNEPQQIDWEGVALYTALFKANPISGILDTIAQITSPIVYNYLIVPVCFPDTDAYTNWNVAFLDTLIFDMNYKSVAKYYHDVSFGKVQIVGTVLPSKLGWIVAPQSYKYYTNDYYGLGQAPQNTQGLIRSLIPKLDSMGINFADYDNDHNGYVDGIGFITCLPGAEVTGNTNNFWSVKWGIAPLRYDNVWVGSSFYLAAGRYSNDHNSKGRMGVNAHEIGHMFGWPDDYASSWGGTGGFDLMANGSWNNNGNTPAGLMAYHYAKTGWVSPSEIYPGHFSFFDTLNPIFREPAIYKIYMANGNLKEYWLMTVRGDTLWDDFIPGFGLTLERVSEIGNQNSPWCATKPEFQSGKPFIMLEQADGLCNMASGSRGDNTDPFPLTNNHSFTGTSNPPSVYYNLNKTGLAITNIQKINNTAMSPVSFTVAFCDCGVHGDLNGDSVLNILDLSFIVNIAFRGGPPIKHPNCNFFTSDLDLDGDTDIFDVVRLVNYVMRNDMNAILNPCK